MGAVAAALPTQSGHDRPASPARMVQRRWYTGRYVADPDFANRLERLDRRAYDDVLVGPRREFGGMAGAVALVSGVRPLAGDTPVSDRWTLRQAEGVTDNVRRWSVLLSVGYRRN